MKITKFGHCCLLINHKGVKILTDPGSYTVETQSKLKDIDFILITHEHQDHLHVESLDELVSNNPKAKIITNSAVGKILDEAGILYELIEDGTLKDLNGIEVETFSEDHALIHSELPRVWNSGFLIDKTFFYPGDALINPNREIEILALPVAGPWIKISESIDYAILLNPKKCFPVHDAGLKEPGMTHRASLAVLGNHNIEFIPIDGKGEVDL